MTTSDKERLFIKLIVNLAADSLLAERALRLHGETALADRIKKGLEVLDELVKEEELSRGSE